MYLKGEMLILKSEVVGWWILLILIVVDGGR